MNIACSRPALKRLYAGLLLGGLLVQPCYGNLLNLPQVYQEKNQWCWAASCEAVLEFYGVSSSQTTLAVYGAEGQNVWNYLWGSGTPDGIYRRGCNLIIQHFGAVSAAGFTGTLSAAQLQAEIDALRPVFVNWAWDSGGGHILIARGMTNDQVYLMDPWYGPSLSDYDWVVSGSGHTWQWTLRLTTESCTTNGTPRWWLGSHGLTNGWDWNANASIDHDGDGIEAWEEYVADTIPTNQNSFFSLSLTDPGRGTSGNMVISWGSSTNRFYTLERATNTLLVPGWTNIPALTAVQGTGGIMTHTNTTASGSGSFRVRASTRP